MYMPTGIHRNFLYTSIGYVDAGNSTRIAPYVSVFDGMCGVSKVNAILFSFR